MSKKVLNALGKVFEAEFSGRLPFQSRSKIYENLESDGLVQKMERHFSDNPFPVIVRGWALTERGRFEYCSNCKEVPE